MMAARLGAKTAMVAKVSTTNGDIFPECNIDSYTDASVLLNFSRYAKRIVATTALHVFFLVGLLFLVSRFKLLYFA